MAKQWFAYNYVAKIALVERGKKDVSSPTGSFFNSWDDAHAHVIWQAENWSKTAQLQMKQSQRHLARVKAMKQPNLVSAD